MTDVGDLNRFWHFKLCFKFNKIDVFRALDNEGAQYLGQFQQLPQQAAARYFPADFSQMIFFNLWYFLSILTNYQLLF